MDRINISPLRGCVALIFTAIKISSLWDWKEIRQTIEEDIFKIIIPLTEQATDQAERTKKIVSFCKTGKSANEIMNFLGLKHREYFRSEILNPLLEKGILHPTIPDKLTSPKQKYISVTEKKKKQ